eukprot:8052909-Pyramimonas_sp.AAC.2
MQSSSSSSSDSHCTRLRQRAPTQSPAGVPHSSFDLVAQTLGATFQRHDSAGEVGHQKPSRT